MRGGSLSAGIEGRGDAAGTTRGCLSNALWLQEKGMKGGKEEAHSHTRSIQTHSLHSCPHKEGVRLEILAEKGRVASLLYFHLDEEEQIKVCRTFSNRAAVVLHNQ